jgi:hypothetical protein
MVFWIVYWYLKMKQKLYTSILLDEDHEDLYTRDLGVNRVPGFWPIAISRGKPEPQMNNYHDWRWLESLKNRWFSGNPDHFMGSFYGIMMGYHQHGINGIDFTWLYLMLWILILVAGQTCFWEPLCAVWERLEIVEIVCQWIIVEAKTWIA